MNIFVFDSTNNADYFVASDCGVAEALDQLVRNWSVTNNQDVVDADTEAEKLAANASGNCAKYEYECEGKKEAVDRDQAGRKDGGVGDVALADYK